MTKRKEQLSIAVNPGEPLGFTREPHGDVWWRGKQWIVTEYGIECLAGDPDCEHGISKDELAGEIPLKDELSGIKWIDPSRGGREIFFDLDDLMSAYFVGCAMHGVRLSKAKVRTMRARFARRKNERIAQNRAVGACDDCRSPESCAGWYDPPVFLACGGKPRLETTPA